ncbi:glycosyl hydrolase 53 family protein [Allorhizocola rhizosphaerae]|uniref:glycosyl hydrolase 53 family protein n=1 Tax=Allorhizocola rhizosphaerae TaxID=1872709 RepID=UPI000E3E94DD|nr:glycosyl hydrolase 53 family protein [Allorhizocola rhizosphaerae]
MRKSLKRPGAALLAASITLAALLVSAPRPAVALSGTANYTPAESNISGKYWVSATASSGDASLALDGSAATAWVATSQPATLTVDLGGAYDAIHKVETVFASNRTVYKYQLQGSRSGNDWTVLADRGNNARPGGVFTDVFDFEGLRYLRLVINEGSPVGVREFNIFNYLRPDMDNGSDTSEQGGNTTAYYYNAGNNPRVPGVRGGKFTDPGSIENGNNFFGLTKDLGWDTIRLRVWNEPKNESTGGASTGAGNSSPANTRRVAKAVIGAGQKLAIDLHYADSWADPQNQPKPYAWADRSFDALVQTTYQWTYDFVSSLVAQGTTPDIVQLGNEVTNGMMWGREYDAITPYVHHHHYYTSGRYRLAPGGGVKWMKYEEARGDTNSAAYQEFLRSINNLARLVDAGNRAIKQVNATRGTHIQSMLHFAFNVIEQTPTGKVVLDPNQVFARVMTLINALSGELNNMSGMVERIGLSYYPDWHGSYAVLQRNLVEISKVLPGVKLNIAEMSPPSSGRVTDPLSDPNHPVGFTYTVQSQGDDTMAAMKTINDIPNNAGTGVWPWAGTNVFATGSGANGTLRASFKVWNDAFAKNVVESHVFAATRARVAPTLPTTVTSLDLRTGVRSTVRVTWSAINPASYATPGTFTVSGTATITNLGSGKGKAMTAVKATVEVT